MWRLWYPNDPEAIAWAKTLESRAEKLEEVSA